MHSGVQAVPFSPGNRLCSANVGNAEDDGNDSDDGWDAVAM